MAKTYFSGKIPESVMQYLILCQLCEQKTSHALSENNRQCCMELHKRGMSLVQGIPDPLTSCELLKCFFPPIESSDSSRTSSPQSSPKLLSEGETKKLSKVHNLPKPQKTVKRKEEKKTLSFCENNNIKTSIKSKQSNVKVLPSNSKPTANEPLKLLSISSHSSLKNINKSKISTSSKIKNNENINSSRSTPKIFLESSKLKQKQLQETSCECRNYAYCTRDVDKTRQLFTEKYNALTETTTRLHEPKNVRPSLEINTKVTSSDEKRFKKLSCLCRIRPRKDTFCDKLKRCLKKLFQHESSSYRKFECSNFSIQQCPAVMKKNSPPKSTLERKLFLDKEQRLESSKEMKLICSDCGNSYFRIEYTNDQK